MKKRLIVFTAVVAVALSIVQAGLAWHANGVTVAAPCVNGAYALTATIDQSSSWPGATVKSITPSSFPGNTTGTKSVVVVIKWANSNDTQTFNKSVTLTGNCTVPTPDPVCPDGYTSAGMSNGVLLCTKTTTVTVEVPVEVIKEVPVEVIKTVEVPGPTQTVYVEKIVEVAKDVPGPTVTKTVVKWKTKVVNHTKVKVKYVYKTKYVTKIKKVQSIGVCKVPGGGSAVQGNG